MQRLGMALDAWMLLPGWQTGKTSRDEVGLEAVADHVDHLCQLAARRYSDAQIDAVFHGNWLRFFLDHMPGPAGE